MKTGKTLLELTVEEARNFLLKNEHYCDIDFPPYFKFTNVLNETCRYVERSGNGIDFKKMCSCDSVNYRLLQNKDGLLSWRKMQIINPVAYVRLVNIICQSWNEIVDRFKEFQSNEKIVCTSMPVVSSDSDSKDKAAMISNWWTNFEQKSVESALKYQFIYKTDIANCYDSIYTHSLAWALHGKEEAKAERRNPNLVGNKIDRALQDMQYAQTNGIPQGSTLMDFVAEMVLGYMDMELSAQIRQIGIDDYLIMRYRDDYRIFVNSERDGCDILKRLNQVAFEVGLRFNSSKTMISNDVISSSIKSDKLDWIRAGRFNKDIQKQLLAIREHLRRNPNSGVACRELIEVYKRIKRVRNVNAMPLISIVVDMACSNPKLHSSCAGVLSILLSFIESDMDKIDILKLIYTKFSQNPHSGHMYVWLQRVSIPYDKDIEYKEDLCRIVKGEQDVCLWGMDWLEGHAALHEIVRNTPIINSDEIDRIGKEIKLKEFELFLDRMTAFEY